MSVYGGVGGQLAYLLKNNATVSELVSARIYPNIVPQRGTFPCVVYNQINSQRTSVMGQDTGTVESVWQLDVYAQTYAGARELAVAVRKAIQRYRGFTPVAIQADDVLERDSDNVLERDSDAVVQRTLLGTKLIQQIFIDADTDFYEDDTRLHRVSIDIRVWYDESGE
ncbi:MAG TPA: DUF3168 domain-containing protein [Acidimicrobiia bacterium]